MDCSSLYNRAGREGCNVIRGIFAVSQQKNASFFHSTVRWQGLGHLEMIPRKRATGQCELNSK